jgi:hypothetical protein
MPCTTVIDGKVTNTVGTGTVSVTIVLPLKGTLRRVEAFLGTPLASPSSVTLDAAYIYKTSLRGQVASIIMRDVALTDKDMVSWDGELPLEEDWSIQFNFINGTIGDIYVGACMVDVP